jgi:protein-tyrosine phosphatase
MSEQPRRLLFVCLGNIVRSPLAEHMFRHRARLVGLDGKYQVDSAGTSAWHIGESPDPRMRRVALAHGLAYNGRARQVRAEDFKRFDLILAMDQSNYQDLLRMARTPHERAKVRLLRDFEPEGEGAGLAVPDPYYGGPEGFEATYRIVERAVQGLLHALEGGRV